MENILDLAYYKSLLKRDYDKGVHFLTTALLNEENALELINDKNAILTIYDENDPKTYILSDVVNSSEYCDQAIENYFKFTTNKNLSENININSLKNIINKGTLKNFYYGSFKTYFDTNIIKNDSVMLNLINSDFSCLEKILEIEEIYSDYMSFKGIKRTLSVRDQIIEQPCNAIVLLQVKSTGSSNAKFLLQKLMNGTNAMYTVPKTPKKDVVKFDSTKEFKITPQGGDPITDNPEICYVKY